MESTNYEINDTTIVDYINNQAYKGPNYIESAKEITYKIENGLVSVLELIRWFEKHYVISEPHIAYEMNFDPFFKKAIEDRDVSKIHHIAFAYARLYSPTNKLPLEETIQDTYESLRDKTLADSLHGSSEDEYEWFSSVELSHRIETYHFMERDKIFPLLLMVYDIPLSKQEEIEKDTYLNYGLEKKSVSMVNDAITKYVPTRTPQGITK